jgi:hypothetical protein
VQRSQHLVLKLQHSALYVVVRSLQSKHQRNRRRILGAAIVATMSAAAAIATGSAEASPGHHQLMPYVLAGGEQLRYGQAGQPPQAFTIDAHGVTNKAKGTILFTPPQGSFETVTRARVTCLTVSSNDAVITGTQTSRGKGYGQTIVAEIVNGGSARKDLLRFSFCSFLQPGALPGCSVSTLGPSGGVTAAGIQIGT